MNLFDQIWQNLFANPRPGSPPEIKIIFIITELLYLFLVLLTVFFIYRNLKKAGHSPTGQLLLGTILSLATGAIGSLILDLYGLITGMETLALSYLLIYASYALTLALFVFFYTNYTRKIVIASERLRKIYTGLSKSVITISLFYILIILVFILTLSPIPIDLLSVFAIILVVLCVFIGVLLSLRDYFRVADKLVRVRLGSIILAGGVFFLHVSMTTLYSGIMTLEFSWDTHGALLTTVAILMYVFLAFVAIILYWGFFIPRKIQEWTGILPPSYRLLLEKKRLLAQQAKKLSLK